MVVLPAGRSAPGSARARSRPPRRQGAARSPKIKIKEMNKALAGVHSVHLVIGRLRNVEGQKCPPSVPRAAERGDIHGVIFDLADFERLSLAISITGKMIFWVKAFI